MAEFKVIQKAVATLAMKSGWAADRHSGLNDTLANYLAKAVSKRSEPPIWQVYVPPTAHAELFEKAIKTFDGIARQLPGEGWRDDVQPQGALIEFADAVIRMMEFCESKGWDLENAIRLKHQYNKTISSSNPNQAEAASSTMESL